MAMNALNDYCQPISPFWRNGPISNCPLNRTECHDEVDLSPCFEDTVILNGIVGLFFLLSAFQFAIDFFSPNENIHKRKRSGLVYYVKILLLFVPLSTALCEFGYTIDQGTSERGEQVAQFQYVSPALVALSMVLCLLVMFRNRKTGQQSSGLLFCFWLGLVVYGSIKLRTLIILSVDNNGVQDIFRFTIFVLQYASFIVQFVLALFPDLKSTKKKSIERRPCPEADATFLSRITWWWQNGQIWHGWRHPLKYEYLTDLNEEDKSEVIAPLFQKRWDQEVRKAEHRNSTPSIILALVKVFWKALLLSAMFKLSQDLLTFASPLILKLMINFTKNLEINPDIGYLYAVLLFVIAVVQSLFMQQHLHLCFTLGMKLRTILIAAVYNKSLRLSNKARQTSTSGEIVTLMSVDTQRFTNIMPFIHLVWSAPLQIILALLFLYNTMGVSVFAGFAVMVLLIPINTGIAACVKKLDVMQMVFKSYRIKVINEVLNGIKVIKLYAWELPFLKLIIGIRENELTVLKNAAYLNTITIALLMGSPFLVSLATFATYSLINLNNPNEQLTADKAFVAISLFNILRYPLTMLPRLIAMLVQMNVSSKRLRVFLMSDELDPNAVTWNDASDDDNAVTMANGTFSWDDESTKATLSEVNFEVRAGELVAVVGQVGAGKSSLIQALLGEMERIDGTVSIQGQVAYVPQQAWIQNATVQDNILFGKQMNGVLYNKCLHGCALGPDLDILPGGDMTEIGEKGINLSGGQKQRVSLARAVYQEADIYLMDDTLSAVDSHVGKHIFEQVIGPKGLLTGKARVLVTHGIGFLPQCDKVVVMVDGRITETGTYTELIESNGAFAEFLRTYSNVEDATNESEEKEHFETPEVTESSKKLCPEVFECVELLQTNGTIENGVEEKGIAGNRSLERQSSQESFSMETKDLLATAPQTKQSSVSSKEQKEEATLIQKEEIKSGNILSAMFHYFKAYTWIMSGLVFFFFAATSTMQLSSQFWLAKWSDADGKLNNSNLAFCDDFKGSKFMAVCYLGGYAGLGFFRVLFILLGAVAISAASVFASRTLHGNMLNNIFRSPMSFFDTTPLGRILNRFSKDVYIIDQLIPLAMRSFLSTLFTVVSAILGIMIAIPIFCAVILPLAIFYLIVQRIYVATSRRLRHLESTTRSPIYSHFQETLTGASTIRAYRKQKVFMLESQSRVDHNQITYYPGICAMRWLGIRLLFIGNLVVLFAALFAVIERNYPEHFPGLSAGIVGLSLTYALQITKSLNWLVRMTSDLETNIVAVERVREYAETPREAPAIVESHRPPPDWPSEGNVQFDQYSTRYREGLDLVLRNISVQIPGQTTVGIVGRTGAGKSSLTLALFRIIESAGGAILIDDINIAVLGLDDLRSRITIIPQDPVLFSGTLRMNLDPFNTHTDQEVWSALENAHLSSFVSGLEKGLDHEVTEGGDNLSVGQRQLVCLARALLRKTKILVLDEATAAVDLETDDLIQNTIKSEFADCTVLTIAHRLNTIMDYDMVMVLDSGRIVEYDSPANLLSNQESIFYSMAKDAGLA